VGGKRRSCKNLSREERGEGLGNSASPHIAEGAHPLPYNLRKGEEEGVVFLARE